MKKILAITLLLVSLALLGASCKKGESPSLDSSQITIPVELTDENVTKAINAASKELDWPYANRELEEKNWTLEKYIEGQGHAINNMLTVIKDPGNWVERKQDQCGSTTVEYLKQSTVTQLSLNSPQEGQACFITHLNHENESKAMIKIFLKENWEISTITFGNSFSDVKPILDHFLNNLE